MQPQAMADVGKVSLLSANFKSETQRLIQCKMRNMALGLQGVYHQRFCAFYFLNLAWRNCFCVGYIGKIANAETKHRQFIMHYFNGDKMQAANIKCFQIDSMHV